MTADDLQRATTETGRPGVTLSPLDLNDLPTYSPWVSRFIESGECREYPKTPAGIRREYGNDKWGTLAAVLEDGPQKTLIDADRAFLGNERTAFSWNEQLYVGTALEARALYRDLVIRTVCRYSPGHIVELGTGYGSIGLGLSLAPALSKCEFTLCDLMAEGLRCLAALGTSPPRIVTGTCDLFALDLRQFQIPSDAVILTSWAMGYVRGFPNTTLREILRVRPSVVIHFEPVVDHWAEPSLLNLLRRRYFTANDYNRDFRSELAVYERQGLLKVACEIENVFGENPLAPVSLIAWTPRS